MRTNIRRIIVAALVLILAIGTGMVASSLWEQRKIDIALEVIELLPEVAQRIQNFHRVKVEDGRKVWEVSAKEARYFEDEAKVSVIKPVVEVYLEEGRTVGMRGEGGEVFLDGKDVRKVDVQGGIEVQIDQYVIRTEFASYEALSEQIVVPGIVRVEGNQLEFDGESMEIDLDSQRLRVTDGVDMLLWPKGSHVGG